MAIQLIMALYRKRILEIIFFPNIESLAPQGRSSLLMEVNLWI